MAKRAATMPVKASLFLSIALAQSKIAVSLLNKTGT
jgi:hypothetical protein